MPHPLSHNLRSQTCGELSCDQCNEQREQAADELDRLTTELANAKNDLLAAKHWGSPTAMDEQAKRLEGECHA